MLSESVTIVGGGLAGALLATMLAQRGYRVRVYEKRADPRQVAAEHGRSINLALAARGIHALNCAGLQARVQPLLIEMQGRMLHENGEPSRFMAYGQRVDEVIYSVGRASLHRLLIETAATYDNIELNFNRQCVALDLKNDILVFENTISGQRQSLPLSPTIATDGAGSILRQQLAKAGVVSVEETALKHDYKELNIPAINNEFALTPNALHVWPRGGFMLIALPNLDRSFTATLFLAQHGTPSFATLTTAEQTTAFFKATFPDVYPLLPGLWQQVSRNPQSQLGSVQVSNWHVGGKVLLLGDAAHAIVPFHGQGMNAAFEDCVALVAQTRHCSSWSQCFAAFEAQRQPHAQAIAQMALENYHEMRDAVRDATFLRSRELALQLERLFPQHFIPRYSMVMFRPDIGYRDALERGRIQQEILELLAQHGDININTALAKELITTRLTPLQN
jgi:kynurenine 3-monooxygenase